MMPKLNMFLVFKIIFVCVPLLSNPIIKVFSTENMNAL